MALKWYYEKWPVWNTTVDQNNACNQYKIIVFEPTFISHTHYPAILLECVRENTINIAN